jgi:hypothetical protein
MKAAPASAPVTVVTGYPGAGKTALLAARAAAQPNPRRVWLSCDSWETSPLRFWTSVATALRPVVPDVGVDALDLLEPGPDVTADVVASLVNDVAVLPHAAELVVDDFHVIPRAGTVSIRPVAARLVPGWTWQNHPGWGDGGVGGSAAYLEQRSPAGLNSK